MKRNHKKLFAKELKLLQKYNYKYIEAIDYIIIIILRHYLLNITDKQR